MKKKKYIREGGICQFFDQWSENGKINHQKLSRAIFHSETIEQRIERSEESYIVEKMKDSDESSQEKKTKEIKPFNREYKNYDTKN